MLKIICQINDINILSIKLNAKWKKLESFV